MRERVKKNWSVALAEVGVSVAGTLGVVYLIAFIVSLQPDSLTAGESFATYFQGGQISLPILSYSGIIFLALFRRQGKTPNPVFAWWLYVVYGGPIIATAIIIGLNPGFKPDVLGAGNLTFLWVLYAALHVLWFLVLVFEPVVPSAQEAARTQEDRVLNMMVRAAQHAP